MDPLQNLTPHIFDNVFQHLKSNDVVEASKVAPNWNYEVNDSRTCSRLLDIHANNMDQDSLTRLKNDIFSKKRCPGGLVISGSINMRPEAFFAQINQIGTWERIIIRLDLPTTHSFGDDEARLYVAGINTLLTTSALTLKHVEITFPHIYNPFYFAQYTPLVFPKLSSLKIDRICFMIPFLMGSPVLESLTINDTNRDNDYLWTLFRQIQYRSMKENREFMRDLVDAVERHLLVLSTLDKFGTGQ